MKKQLFTLTLIVVATVVTSTINACGGSCGKRMDTVRTETKKGCSSCGTTAKTGKSCFSCNK